MRFRPFRWTFSLAALVLAAFPTAILAAVPETQPQSLSRLVKVDPRLRWTTSVTPFGQAGNLLRPASRQAWEAFLDGPGSDAEWIAEVDRKTGYIAYAEGSGLPWIPRLTPGTQEIDLQALERIARAFLPAVAVALGVDPDSLVLSPDRSLRLEEGLWFVDFDVRRGGFPIDGTRVVFRVNHGNLIQLGTENLPVAEAPVPAAVVGRDEARQRLAAYIGGFRRTDLFLDPGSLHLLPAVLGEPPAGSRGLVLAWHFVFRRQGEAATWLARVDATSGEVLELRDTNAYAQVTGGVYPVSYLFGDETVLPMPFADAGAGVFTDSAGSHTSAGPVTSTLNGQYVQIEDNCGPISLTGDAAGNVAFGTGAGTDCDTPGIGSSGNTHAARTQFYHVNRAKEIGRTWLPANKWLSDPLTVEVNIAKTCNAGWDGTRLLFYRSGVGCGNTGEIAAVSLHEYGHGLDWNDGNGPSEGAIGGATGETYGDFTAALLTRSSCMGDGFYSVNCTGYGDDCTSCTGMRDIDYAQHTSGTPHTVANFIQTKCPLIEDAYSGPCGESAHCESYVPSEALWDFVARDLPSPGSDGAWLTAERLWYLSRPTATAAYSCDRSPAVWTTDGCGTGSFWRTMRAVDDDDGDLTNGTPHSCNLFAAMDRHGIACATDAGATLCSSTCTPPSTVTGLTAAPAATQVDLAWSSSGAGAVYDIYRSESGCAAGFLRIANDLAGLAFSDTSVSDGLTYSYQVVAHASGSAGCAAPPSACQSTVVSEPTDVWSQDNPSDIGTEPSSGDMWKSDDIWVNTLASGGSHENAELGSVNYVHVRVRNRGTATAHKVHVRVYFADASTGGLSWPADWKPIGTASLESLGSGADDEVALPWSPPGTGHFCLLVRLVAGQDPMTTAETADIDFNTRSNNNIVWKNVVVVDLLKVKIVAFTLANPEPRASVFRLTFREAGEQPRLLHFTRITVVLGEKLFRRWVAAGRPGKGVRQRPGHVLEIMEPEAWLLLPLEAGERHGPCLFFDLGGLLPPPSVRFRFEVVQDRVEQGEVIPVGGIAYDLKAGD